MKTKLKNRLVSALLALAMVVSFLPSNFFISAEAKGATGAPFTVGSDGSFSVVFTEENTGSWGDMYFVIVPNIRGGTREYVSDAVAPGGNINADQDPDIDTFKGHLQSICGVVWSDNTCYAANNGNTFTAGSAPDNVTVSGSTITITGTIPMGSLSGNHENYQMKDGSLSYVAILYSGSDPATISSSIGTPSGLKVTPAKYKITYTANDITKWDTSADDATAVDHGSTSSDPWRPSKSSAYVEFDLENLGTSSITVRRRSVNPNDEASDMIPFDGDELPLSELMGNRTGSYFIYRLGDATPTSLNQSSSTWSFSIAGGETVKLRIDFADSGMLDINTTGTFVYDFSWLEGSTPKSCSLTIELSTDQLSLEDGSITITDVPVTYTNPADYAKSNADVPMTFTSVPVTATGQAKTLPATITTGALAGSKLTYQVKKAATGNTIPLAVGDSLANGDQIIVTWTPPASKGIGTYTGRVQLDVGAPATLSLSMTVKAVSAATSINVMKNGSGWTDATHPEILLRVGDTDIDGAYGTTTGTEHIWTANGTLGDPATPTEAVTYRVWVKKGETFADTGIDIPVVYGSPSTDNSLYYYDVNLADGITGGTATAAYAGNTVAQDSADKHIGTILANAVNKTAFPNEVTTVANNNTNFSHNWTDDKSAGAWTDPTEVNSSWTLKDDHTGTGAITLNPNFARGGVSMVLTVNLDSVAKNGLAVQVKDASSQVVGTTQTTDSNGQVTFNGLTGGATYTAEVTTTGYSGVYSFTTPTAEDGTATLDYYSVTVAPGTGSINEKVAGGTTLNVLKGKTTTLTSAPNEAAGYGGDGSWDLGTNPEGGIGAASSLSGNGKSATLTVNGKVIAKPSYTANSITINVYLNGALDAVTDREIDLRVTANETGPCVAAQSTGATAGGVSSVTFSPVGRNGTTDPSTYYIFVGGNYTGHTVQCAPGKDAEHDLYYYEVKYGDAETGGKYTSGSTPITTQEVLAGGTKNSVTLEAVTPIDANYNKNGWKEKDTTAGSFTPDTEPTTWTISADYTGNGPIILIPKFIANGKYTGTVIVKHDGALKQNYKVELLKDGKVAETLYTDANGEATKAGLEGAYTVRVSGGTVDTTIFINDSNTLDSATTPLTLEFFTVTATEGTGAATDSAKVASTAAGADKADKMVFQKGLTAHLSSKPDYAAGYGNAGSWKLTKTADNSDSSITNTGNGGADSFEVGDHAVTATASYPANEITVNVHKDGPVDTNTTKVVELRDSTGAAVTNGTTTGADGVFTFTAVGGATSASAVTYKIYVKDTPTGTAADTGITVSCKPGFTASQDLRYFTVQYGDPETGGQYYTTPGTAIPTPTTTYEVLAGGVNNNVDSLATVEPINGNYDRNGWEDDKSAGTFAPDGTTKTSWTIKDDYTGNDEEGAGPITLIPKFARNSRYTGTITVKHNNSPAYNATTPYQVTLTPTSGTDPAITRNTDTNGQVSVDGLSGNYTVTVTHSGDTFVYKTGANAGTLTSTNNSMTLEFFDVSAAKGQGAATAKVASSAAGANAGSKLTFQKDATAHLAATKTAPPYTGAATWSFVLKNPDPTTPKDDVYSDTTSFQVQNQVDATAKYTHYEAMVTTYVDGTAGKTGITSVALMKSATDASPVAADSYTTAGENTYTLTVGNGPYTHAKVVTNASGSNGYVIPLSANITGPEAPNNRTARVDLYTLTVKVADTPNNGGKVKITESNGTSATVQANTTLNITATPNSGNMFSLWALTGNADSTIASTVTPGTTVTVKAPHTGEGAADNTGTVATASFVALPTPTVDADVYRIGCYGYENGYLKSLSVKANTDVTFYYTLSESGTYPTADAVVTAGSATTPVNSGHVPGTHASGVASWTAANERFTNLKPYTKYYVYAVAVINGVNSAVGRGEFITDHKVTVGVAPTSGTKQGKVSVTQDSGGTATTATDMDQVFSVAHGGTLYNLTATPNTPTAYAFKNWTVTANGGTMGDATASGSSTDYTASGTAKEITITANFEPLYHVEYDENGGTMVAPAKLPDDPLEPGGHRTSQDIIMDATITKTDISKPGFTFQGWATKADATSKVTSRTITAALNDQPTVGPGGTIKVYAVWTANALTGKTATLTAVYNMDEGDWETATGTTRPAPSDWATSGKTVTGPIDLDAVMADSGGSGSYTFAEGTNFPSYLNIAQRTVDDVTHYWIVLDNDARIGAAGDNQDFVVNVHDTKSGKDTTITVEYDVDKAIPQIANFVYTSTTAENTNWYKNDIILRGKITADVTDEFESTRDLHIPGKHTWTAYESTFQETDETVDHNYTFTFTVTGENKDNYYTADEIANLHSKARDPNLEIDPAASQTYIYKVGTQDGSVSGVAPYDVTVNLSNTSTKGSTISGLTLTSAPGANAGGVFTTTTTALGKTTLAASEATTFTFRVNPDQPVGTYEITFTVNGTAGEGEGSETETRDAVYKYTLYVVEAELDHANGGLLTAPEAGKTPVKTAPTQIETTPDYRSNYTASEVTWKDVSSGTVVNGSFQAGRQYSASITLTPKANYWFVEPNTGNMPHDTCEGYWFNGKQAQNATGNVTYSINPTNHTVTLTYVFDRLPAEGLTPSISAVDYKTAKVDSITMPVGDDSVTSVKFYYVVTDREMNDTSGLNLTSEQIRDLADGTNPTRPAGVVAGLNAVGAHTATVSDGDATWTPGNILNDLKPNAQYWIYAVAEVGGTLTDRAVANTRLPKALTVEVDTAYGTVDKGAEFYNFPGTSIASLPVGPGPDASDVLSMGMSGESILSAQYAPITGSELNNLAKFALKDIKVSTANADGTAITTDQQVATLAQNYTYDYDAAAERTTVVFSFRQRITGKPTITPGTDASGDPSLTVAGGDTSTIFIGNDRVTDVTRTDLTWQWQYKPAGDTEFIDVLDADGGKTPTIVLRSSNTAYAGAEFQVTITYTGDPSRTYNGVPGVHSAVSNTYKPDIRKLDAPTVKLDPSTQADGGLDFEITELSTDDFVPAGGGDNRVKDYTVKLYEEGNPDPIATLTIPADGDTLGNHHWPLDGPPILDPNKTYEVQVVANPTNPSQFLPSDPAKDDAKPEKKTLEPWDITWIDRTFNGQDQYPYNTRPTAPGVGAGAVTINATLDTSQGTYKAGATTIDPNYGRTDDTTTIPAAEQQKFAATYNMTVSVAEGTRYKALDAFRAGDWHIKQAQATMTLKGNGGQYTMTVTTESKHDVGDMLTPTVTYPKAGTGAEYNDGTVTGYYDYKYELITAPAGSRWTEREYTQAELAEFAADKEDSTGYIFRVTATYKTDPRNQNFEVDVSEPAVRTFTVLTNERTPTGIHLYWEQNDVPAADQAKIPANITFNPKATKDVTYGAQDGTYMNDTADNADAKDMELTHLVVRIIYDNGASESWHTVGTNALPAGLEWVIGNTALVSPVTDTMTTMNPHIHFGGAGNTGIQVRLGKLTSPETVTYTMAPRVLNWTVTANPKTRVWNGSNVVTAINTPTTALAGDDATITSTHQVPDANVGKDKEVSSVSASVTGDQRAYYTLGTGTTDVMDITPAHVNWIDMRAQNVKSGSAISAASMKITRNDEPNTGTATTGRGLKQVSITWKVWDKDDFNDPDGKWIDANGNFLVNKLYRATVTVEADENHYLTDNTDTRIYSMEGKIDGEARYPAITHDETSILPTEPVADTQKIHPALGVLYNNQFTFQTIYDTTEIPELRFDDYKGSTLHCEPNTDVVHREAVTVGDSLGTYTINLNAFVKDVIDVTVNVTKRELLDQPNVTLTAKDDITHRDLMTPGVDAHRITYDLTLPNSLTSSPGEYTLQLTAKGSSSEANRKAGIYDVKATYNFVLVVSKKSEDRPVPGGGGGTTTIIYPVVKYWVSDNGYTDDLTAERMTKQKGGKPSFVPKITPMPGLKFLGWSEEDPTKLKEGKLPTLVDPLTFTIDEDKIFYAVYERVDIGHSHYVIGFPDGTFGPDSSITRGQVATIIARSCLEDFVEGGSYGNPGNYTDVDSHWANSAIAYCSMKGVFTGYEDGTFRPDRYISRQELATVVARLAGVEINEGLPFSDAEDISSWALNGIYTNYVNGWVNGYTDGTFKPLNNITRAETVKIFNGYLGRGVDREGLSELREYVHTGTASNIQDGTDEYMTWPDVAKSHWAYYEIIEAANDHNFRWRDTTKAAPPEDWYEAFIDATWRYVDDANDGADDVGRDELPVFTVTYVVKSNGVTWDSVTEQVTKFSSPDPAKLPKAEPSEGYRFAGWSDVDPDTGEFNLVDPTASAVLEDKTFYAIFEAKLLITYVVGEHGSTDMALSERINKGESPTTTNLPKITAHEGWRFAGWSETDPATGVVTLTDPTDHPAYADATFYATYEREGEYTMPQVTVTYVLGDRGESDGALVQTFDQYESPRVELLPRVTAREGWQFLGWSETDPANGDYVLTDPTAQSILVDKSFYAVYQSQEPAPTEPKDPTVEPGDEPPLPVEDPPAVEPADPLPPVEPADPVGPGDPTGPEPTEPPAESHEPSEPLPPVEDLPLEYARKRYINGYTDNTFRPDDAFTRAAVATVLANLTGYDPEADYGVTTFTDLEVNGEDHWATNAITFCVSEGLMSGYTDGTFRPDNPISRQEFAVVLTRLTGETESGDLPFADADAIAPWAADSVYTVYAQGWINGYDDGTFLPERNVTRAEAVKMLNRYLDRPADRELIESQSGYTVWADVPETHWAYYEIIEASNDWLE